MENLRYTSALLVCLVISTTTGCFLSQEKLNPTEDVKMPYQFIVVQVQDSTKEMMDHEEIKITVPDLRKKRDTYRINVEDFCQDDTDCTNGKTCSTTLNICKKGTLNTDKSATTDKPIKNVQLSDLINLQ